MADCRRLSKERVNFKEFSNFLLRSIDRPQQDVSIIEIERRLEGDSQCLSEKKGCGEGKHLAWDRPSVKTEAALKMKRLLICIPFTPLRRVRVTRRLFSSTPDLSNISTTCTGFFNVLVSFLGGAQACVTRGRI